MRKSNNTNGSGRLPFAGRQRGFLSSRQAFVLLALIFLAPAFVAWVMHHSGEQGWRPGGMTNRGVLVHPARPLDLPADVMIGNESVNDYLQGLWTLVYIGDADCDAICNENLYKMRQIRIAQNENMNRVQRLYMVAGAAVQETLTVALEKEYPQMDVVPVSAVQEAQLAPYFLIDDVPMQGAERVYIIDPLGNLMMYYPQDADPGGMLKDLKKLLKYSKIG
jgi:cytochrome oxidase Cu insertion factor (SCO1/SenC/PrrC family)